MARPCLNTLLMHAIEKYLPKNLAHLKVDFNRIHMGMHFVHGFILDATFRTIIDAILDQVRGKLGTKIDARTSIEPGPV